MCTKCKIKNKLKEICYSVSFSFPSIISRLFQSEFNADIKVFDDSHLDQLLRCLCDTACTSIHWRQMRSYLLAEEATVTPQTPDPSSACDLVIRGYIHGMPLSVYDLVHITGESSHQIRSIRVLPDPSPLKKVHGIQEQCYETIIADPARLQSLKEECDIDPSTVQQPQWPMPTQFVMSMKNE